MINVEDRTNLAASWLHRDICVRWIILFCEKKSQSKKCQFRDTMVIHLRSETDRRSLYRVKGRKTKS